MTEKVLYRQNKALFKFSPTTARPYLSELASNSQVDFDVGSLTGTQSKSHKFEYEWTIEREAEGCIITESVFVEEDWLTIFSIGIIAAGLGLAVIKNMITSPTSVDPSILVAILISLFLFMLIQPPKVGVIDEDVESMIKYKTTYPFYIHFVSVTLGAVLAFASYYVGLFQLIDWISYWIIILGITTRLFYDRYIWLAANFDVESVLPSPSVEYILDVLRTFLVPAGLIFTQRLIRTSMTTERPAPNAERGITILQRKLDSITPESLKTLTANKAIWIPSDDVLLMEVIALTLFAFYTMYICYNTVKIYSQTKAYGKFKQGKRDVKSRYIQLLSLIIAVLPGYLGIGILLELWKSFGLYFRPAENIFPSILFIIILLRLLLPIIGLLFQIIGTIFTFSALLFSSESILLSDLEWLNAEVRQCHTSLVDVGHVSSFSIGFSSYIFISETAYQEMGIDEFHAILAHEQSHIDHKEAVFSFVAPFASTILLIGQNILYAVIDFRSREFRADKEAAEKVGSEPLVNAMKKIKGVRQDSVEKRLLAPSFVSYDTKPDNWFKRYLFLFYGGFAMTDAHPSVDERETALLTEYVL